MIKTWNFVHSQSMPFKTLLAIETTFDPQQKWHRYLKTITNDRVSLLYHFLKQTPLHKMLIHNNLMRSRKNRVSSTVKHSLAHISKTHKHELVYIMYQLSLSILYSHVLDISTELGNKISHHYHIANAVCPPELKCDLFITAAVYNICHQM